MLQMANCLGFDDADDTVVPLNSDEDVVRLRQTVREFLVSAGFSLIDQTKMVTAASELARNTLRYGGGGETRITKVADGARRGGRRGGGGGGPGGGGGRRAGAGGY